MTDSYHERLRTHLPRCLGGVRAYLQALAANESAATDFVYELRGTRDERLARVWGFDLRRLRDDVSDRKFVSPLDLSWDDSSERVRLFDSDRHGYHGELGCSAKIRGNGEPEAFSCPECGTELFEVRVRLSYWDAVEDLWEDEPGSIVEDYFCNFELSGTCSGCHQATTICTMDL